MPASPGCPNTINQFPPGHELFVRIVPPANALSAGYPIRTKENLRALCGGEYFICDRIYEIVYLAQISGFQATTFPTILGYCDSIMPITLLRIRKRFEGRSSIINIPVEIVASG